MVCMIHSENTLMCAFKSFQNKSYIPQLSTTGKNFRQENPSVLMGCMWQSATVMASTCEKTIWKISPIGANILQSFQGKSVLRM